MNDNHQTIIKNYILIIKTLQGDPENNITVIIKGNNGQTDKILLEKSQSYHKWFKDNQTDLFLLLSNIDVGKIDQIEFYANINAKFKEWKFNSIFIIDGTRVYRDIISEYSLLPSINIPSVVNFAERCIESQESIYYVFVKTGNDSCSKECYPKLTLFGNNHQRTEINMKSSINNNFPLQKYQFDIFQWQDHNIGNIERMCLQLFSETKQSKCQWPIEWMFVIHNGYSFTGRIMLNRIIKIDRFIDIDFDQKILPITGEYGDSSDILNRQSNATTDDIGRYYVMIRNIDGTNGDVYIDFHGDRLSSSGEQHLSKCENYPDHPFSSKHTDLFHIKALEVGHIHSVSIRLDQTNKEHSLTLDSLYIIHNAIVYQFDLKYIILNKEESKKEFISRLHPKLSIGKACYYIATHTADKMLWETNVNVKIVVKGTKGMFGPIELNESLTNGNNLFEKESIGLFHIEDNDIGDPISMTITLQPKDSLSDIINSVKYERIMLIKNGEYNSLWQSVGELKSNESKTISLPIHHQQQSLKQSTLEQISSSKTKLQEQIETKPIINNIENFLSGDYHKNNLILAEIEDHQKRHTFAPNLYQAQENYRELRRLLKKMNRPSISKEKKTRATRKRSIVSNRQKIKRIS